MVFVILGSSYADVCSSVQYPVKFAFSSLFDAIKPGCGVMIVSLWLGLWEFGQDFDTVTPAHDHYSADSAPNESLLCWLGHQIKWWRFVVHLFFLQSYCLEILQNLSHSSNSPKKL